MKHLRHLTLLAICATSTTLSSPVKDASPPGQVAGSSSALVQEVSSVVPRLPVPVLSPVLPQYSAGKPPKYPPKFAQTVKEYFAASKEDKPAIAQRLLEDKEFVKNKPAVAMKLAIWYNNPKVGNALLVKVSDELTRQAVAIDAGKYMKNLEQIFLYGISDKYFFLPTKRNGKGRASEDLLKNGLFKAEQPGQAMLFAIWNNNVEVGSKLLLSGKVPWEFIQGAVAFNPGKYVKTLEQFYIHCLAKDYFVPTGGKEKTATAQDLLKNGLFKAKQPGLAMKFAIWNNNVEVGSELWKARSLRKNADILALETAAREAYSVDETLYLGIYERIVALHIEQREAEGIFTQCYYFLKIWMMGLIKK